MATKTLTLPVDCQSTANFRASFTNFNQYITTGGFWAYATDTGQINWSTVTVPAANTYAGFEMFKTADTLSSSFPIFMKIEYGTNQSPTPGPALRWTFSTSTNGAGTCTGNIIGSFVDFQSGDATFNGGGATPNATGFASGNNGYFSFLPYEAGIGAQWGFPLVVERSCDQNGNYTNAYITVIKGSVITTNQITVNQRSLINPSSGTLSPSLTSCFTIYSTLGSGAFGTFAAPFPVFPFIGYADNPMKAIMGMKSADITEGGNFTTTVYGVAHNYLWSSRYACTLITTANTPASGLSYGVGILYE